MQEETLDELLSNEAVKRGWADTKLDYAARILKYVLAEVEEKDMKDHFTSVIKYLEAYKFDD
jgi:hypothetical protein